MLLPQTIAAPHLRCFLRFTKRMIARGRIPRICPRCQVSAMEMETVHAITGWHRSARRRTTSATLRFPSRMLPSRKLLCMYLQYVVCFPSTAESFNILLGCSRETPAYLATKDAAFTALKLRRSTLPLSPSIHAPMSGEYYPLCIDFPHLFYYFYSFLFFAFIQEWKFHVRIREYHHFKKYVPYIISFCL